MYNSSQYIALCSCLLPLPFGGIRPLLCLLLALCGLGKHGLDRGPRRGEKTGRGQCTGGVLWGLWGVFDFCARAAVWWMPGIVLPCANHTNHHCCVVRPVGWLDLCMSIGKDGHVNAARQSCQQLVRTTWVACRGLGNRVRSQPGWVNRVRSQCGPPGGGGVDCRQMALQHSTATRHCNKAPCVLHTYVVEWPRSGVFIPHSKHIIHMWVPLTPRISVALEQRCKSATLPLTVHGLVGSGLWVHVLGPSRHVEVTDKEHLQAAGNQSVCMGLECYEEAACAATR